MFCLRYVYVVTVVVALLMPVELFAPGLPDRHRFFSTESETACTWFYDLPLPGLYLLHRGWIHASLHRAEGQEVRHAVHARQRLLHVQVSPNDGRLLPLRRNCRQFNSEVISANEPLCLLN